MLNPQGLAMEVNVREGKALKAAGDLIEELRMLVLLTDDDEREALLDRLHNESITIGGDLRKVIG